MSRLSKLIMQTDLNYRRSLNKSINRVFKINIWIILQIRFMNLTKRVQNITVSFVNNLNH